jgi:hypothetical protein
MAHDRDRYRERFERDRIERDRPERERGAFDRAGDEVRSWFGDDEARWRRERDERERGYTPERGYNPERSYNPERTIGNRDYGDRYGRTFDSEIDRERDTGLGPTFQPYARGSQEFGQEGYGSRSYASPRNYRRETLSSETWRVPGPFTGRGPKGYQRSDERIREEVCDRLTAHGLVDATDIEVRIQGGEVTLTGFVDTREAKRAAEDVAEELPGVREVHNQLRIRTHSEDAGGVGRTSVLGLTEHETQTSDVTRTDPTTRSRARNT